MNKILTLIVMLAASAVANAALITNDTLIALGDTSFEGVDLAISNCTVTVDGAHTFNSVHVWNAGKLTHSLGTNGLLVSGFSVSNEIQVLTATDPVALNNSNVVLLTLVVSDTNGPTIYTNGVDYTTGVDTNGFPTIARTVTSTIPDGVGVRVSYDVQNVLGPTGLYLVVSNDFEIEAGGRIDVSGLGYDKTGPGGGGSLGFPPSGAGGGHGGYGGLSGTNAPGGRAHDLTDQPNDKGGGGGLGVGGPGGLGGGFVSLQIAGTLRNGGLITANGANALNSRSGGGAGGGIALSGGAITGGGVIRANGGAGEPSLGGGGGGGRIALSFGTNTFSGNLEAHGGAGWMYGGAGTVYTKTGSAIGQAVVDNGGHRGTNTLALTGLPLALTVKSGAVVSLDVSRTATSLLVGSNAAVSLNTFPLIVTGSALIEAGGAINADAKGSPAGQGQGHGNQVSGIGSGAGHGGLGAAAGLASGGGVYGAITQPNQAGSGGGDGAIKSSVSYGGAGGGSVQMSVYGLLTVQGKISSDGQGGVGENSGGGSGGSILLTVGGLAGSGVISAVGGPGNGVGGSGAGGQIAIYYQSNSFSGALQAWGGSTAFNTGGAGTIYTRDARAQVGRVVVDNQGRTGGKTPLIASEAFDVAIQGGAFGTVGILGNFGSLTVASNSLLLFTNSTINVTRDVLVSPGGAITADGAGFPSGQGMGAGGGTFYAPPTGGVFLVGGGGGHGGIGGGLAGGGAAYDTVNNPFYMGSGGGPGSGISPTNFGGTGGGFLRMTVSGNLIVNGRVSVDGSMAPSLNGGGGGGGGLMLTVGTLSGSGVISANGGPNNSLGGGGGGGRVAIVYQTNLFSGAIQALGGGTTNIGGAGTVYLRSLPQNIAQVIADNGGRIGVNTSINEVSSTMDLTLRGGASAFVTSGSVNNLLIASNSWIRFSNSVIQIYGNGSIDAGGGILGDGTGYPGGQGPGPGFSDANNILVTGGGGAHAGFGGAGGTKFSRGGQGYGNSLITLSMGSGGGAGSGLFPTNAGGAGGGSLQLTVLGSLAVNGRISANGGSGLAANSGGGGGGGISITAGNLSGTGIISANGGAGVLAGGGGGGGRIVLRPTVLQFSGLLTAFGGPGANRGGAGVINTRLSTQPVGSLLIDNGGNVGTNTALLESGSMDVTITGGAIAAHTQSGLVPRVLTIQSNGWLKITSTSLNVSSSASVQSGGGIIADGAGLGLGGQGSGGIVSPGSAGGGGYGGAGGANPPGAGRTYGSLQTPTDVGSGGASLIDPNSGGKGGGAVRMTVTGPLAVDGRISANGTDGSPNSGGGSGGTVSLNVTFLLGTGVISANGGAGLGLGGGGGGGRIALAYTTKLFNGSIMANGGGGLLRGGAGTIYQKASNQSVGSVLVDNGGQSGTNSSLGSLGSQVDITLAGGARLVAAPGAMRHLNVGSNSFLIFSSPTSQIAFSGNVTVDPGGGIIADGAGSAGGPGIGTTLSSGLYSTTSGGGGHGGVGGASIAGAAGGLSFDSVISPTLPGGPGGSGAGEGVFPSPGGGVILMTINGVLSVNGRLTSDGLRGAGAGSGGGAGGTLNIVAGGLTGTGWISADGGAGNGYGGGGAGGRVAIRTANSTFSGVLSAKGGAGFETGGAGTIYLTPSSAILGNLIVDNGGQAGAKTPIGNWGNLALEVRNGAWAEPTATFLTLSNLAVRANSKLTSSKTNLDLLVLGNFNLDGQGVLSADSSGFPAGAGPGAGLSTNSIGSGAGYGGIGGASTVSGGGTNYGSATRPADPGSGGGLGILPSHGGSQGGGAIRLSVGGALTVDGLISAEGNSGLDDNSGGGSGGSLWINASAISGNGVLAADGGNGELYQGGGGGGGRIAIYSPNNTFTGELSVLGGDGASAGQAGTVVMVTNLDLPTVIAQDPTGTATNGVSTVKLTFNIPLNPSSASAADFLLSGPAGVVSNMTVSSVAPAALQLDFPTVTAPGVYNLTVGPQIENLWGQAMAAAYNGSFSLDVPVIQGMVTDTNGQPVPGIVLQPSSGSPAITDVNGAYALGYSPGSAITVTPLSASLMFVPGSRNYSNLSGSISNENYLAVTTIAPYVTSQRQGTNLVMGWTGLAGLTYDSFYSTDLVNWYDYDTTLQGTNGPMQLVVPVPLLNLPTAYFRIGARN